MCRNACLIYAVKVDYLHAVCKAQELSRERNGNMDAYVLTPTQLHKLFGATEKCAETLRKWCEKDYASPLALPFPLDLEAPSNSCILTNFE